MNIRKKSAKILVFLFCLAAGAIFALECAAFITPQIYFTQFKIAKQNFKPGERVGGTAEIWNYEPQAAGDLRLAFTLAKKTGDSYEIIDARNGDSFGLPAGGKRSIDFSYWLPFKLPAGDFFLRVKVENSRGFMFGWADAPLAAESSGDFFELVYDAKDAADGTAGSAVISSSANPPLRFQFIRPAVFDKSSTIGHVIRFSSYRSDGSLAGEADLPVSLNAPETQTIDYSLGPFNEPGTYKTAVRVVNKGSGDAVSNILYYSWIVKDGGPAASILYANLDKSAYAAGETARLSVRFSAAGFEGGEDARLFAVLTGKDGEIIGKNERSVSLPEGFGEIDIPVSGPVYNARAAVSIESGGIELDRYEFAAGPEDGLNATSTPPAIVLEDKTGLAALAGLLARIFLVVGVIAVLMLAVFAGYYLKVLRPRELEIRLLKAKAAQAKAKGDSLSDLLREFDEIDKKNKHFKTWK